MPKNIYKLKDGMPCPGVTTICGIETNQEKQDRLISWGWKLGRQGKPWREELKEAGDIGTLVHELVISYWTEEDVDLSGYTEEQVFTARVCTSKIYDLWGDIQEVEPILVEIPLVSEVYKFGGQPDLYATVNGKKRLIDIKTSGGIYDSHWLQLAAYGILLRAVRGFKVDEYQILWLPKDNRFDCPIRKSLKREKQIFKHLLEIYKLRRAE